MADLASEHPIRLAYPGPRSLQRSPMPFEAPRFFERLSGFEKALEAGQNQRPAVRRHADQFRIGLVDLLDERELDRFLLLFKLVSDTRVAFETGFGKDFARATRQDQSPGGIDFEDLPIGNGPDRDTEFPRGAELPRAFLPGFHPVLARELGIGQRLPQLLRSRANEGDVDEARFSHRSLLPVSL